MGTGENVDYYQIDELLTEGERHLRDRVRRFVDDECLPVIGSYFEKATFPLKLVSRLAELKLFGAHIDGYGAHKMSHLNYGLICQELGRCDSGLRALFSVQNSLVMYPIYAFGSEEQRKRWLPKMSRGEVIGCFGLSEPEFGSNPAGMATTAEKSGGGYLLNGTKMWISNGTIAKVAIVWAKLEGEIRGFLVEDRTEGFHATAIQRKFAYRTSPTALISLKNCRVPENSLLPNAAGLRSILQCINLARYGVGCGAVGSAMACYQAAMDFARKRQVFKKPIASYQLIQDRLVRMMMEITKAQLLNYHLGRRMDEAKASHAQISMAKLNNVREAIKVARMARDILGGRGILVDHHVIRHLCDLEAVSTLEGTENIQTLILGKDLTGISAFF